MDRANTACCSALNLMKTPLTNGRMIAIIRHFPLSSSLKLRPVGLIQAVVQGGNQAPGSLCKALPALFFVLHFDSEGAPRQPLQHGKYVHHKGSNSSRQPHLGIQGKLGKEDHPCQRYATSQSCLNGSLSDGKATEPKENLSVGREERKKR